MKKKVISSKSTLRKTQRTWTEKLKHVSLNKLKHVRTFCEGRSSHVSLVQLDGQPKSAFALKTLQKAKIKSQAARRQVMSEKTILSKVQSDFIIKLYKTFKNGKYLYFLTEYCPGGALSNRVPFSEDDAKFYVACVVEALDTLHSNDIVHNDIKPENMVLDAEGYVKVIDFGFAEHLERGELSHNLDGTSAYLPPEVIWSKMNLNETPKGRDRAVDLWALGVLLYTFVGGESPFEVDLNRSLKKIWRNVMKGIDSVQFPKQHFSPEAEDLVRKLCAYDPKQRLGYESVAEIRSHRWFENFNWRSLRNRKLPPPILPKVVSAVDTQNFKGYVEVTPDSKVKKDKSDWDKEF